MTIRPVSDLRNKFPEIEGVVNQGQPVFLTKNGYGTMVVMSIEQYEQLINAVELRLDEADTQLRSSERLSHDDVFSAARAKIREFEDE